MIRIAICDNDIQSLESLHAQIVTRLRTLATDEFLVRRFHSVYDLLECLENPNLSFNVYFLEIEMPIYTGIEVAGFIRQHDEFASIIYLAKSPTFALDASATSPLQYLLKPIDPEELLKALDSAYRKSEPMQSKKLLIKRKDGLSNVALHQIEYIEYRDHVLTFHLIDDRTIDSRTIHESFTEIMDRSLTDSRFLRPHQSFAINMDHVRSLNAKEFELNSGALIPISKRIYKEARQQFLDYATLNNGAVIV